MLARRFMMICLLAAMLGTIIAVAVAGASRSSGSWKIGAVQTCTFETVPHCLSPMRG